MKWLIPIAAVAAVAGVIYVTRNNADAQPDPGQPPADNQSQETTMLEDLQVAIDNAVTPTPQPIQPDGPASDPLANRKAFLDMLAYSEGTSGPNGYRTLFGGGLFDSFDDHPRRAFSFQNSKGETLWTTAAGRYQFLAISQKPDGSYTKINTWDSLKAKLGLPDFSPDSQDAAALELIRQRGALADIDAGNLSAAVQKCSPIWASLPGAGYNQPERKLADLNNAFAQAGGIVAAA